MEPYVEDGWMSRQELADRLGVPVKTPAEWASKGTGPPYAKFGRHVRYRLSVARSTCSAACRQRHSPGGGAAALLVGPR